MKDVRDQVREAGGIVHSDGNIFFTSAVQFIHASFAFTKKSTVWYGREKWVYGFVCGALFSYVLPRLFP